MSTRYMKKVFGNDTLAVKNVENESDVENPVTGNVKAKAFNVFDMLNENSNNEEETIEQQSNEESCPDDAKRKKKKKRRRKVNNQKIERTSIGQDEEEESEDIDEIDRSLREVNKLLGEPIPSCSSQSASSSQWIVEKHKEDILIVQHKHLNPYNELKKIFGSKTVQAENRRDRNRSGHLKKTWLVLPKKNWAPIGKSGLYMTLDTSMECIDDIVYFMFEHSPPYRQLQLKFIEGVESLNPDNIARFADEFMYNVDALIQIAELYKLGEDYQFAAEVTERALYYLECAFHPLFNVTTARCRMDYRKQQNRGFFITLFKHLNMVAGRACYRTSLEFCKLLLSLDPEGDPLAVVLSMDYYALRAREYEWFINFCTLWENSRNLSQLPNIAYSLALAHFHLGNEDHAKELLQNALIMFPGVLVPLLDKCSIQTDQKVTVHEFFHHKATATTSPALDKLQRLYVVRSYNLWKETDILPWLKQGVHDVLERVDSKDPYIKFCEVKRSKRYQGKLPRNILRHIILSDLKDVTVNGHEIQSEGLVLSYDPLPPLDSIDIYKSPRADRRTVGNNSNIISLFFSSLFTDINGEEVHDSLDDLWEHREQA